MATGFIRALWRSNACWQIALVALLLGGAGPALATDVTVVGLFPNKAVLVINGTAPRTMSVGQKSPEGVVLIGADSKTATLEIDGKKRVLEMGEVFAATVGDKPAVRLAADERGHFTTQILINGGSVRALVDTGATLIALPARDAVRLGLDYKKGRPGLVNTANGTAPVFLVQLDNVRLGDISLTQVDAMVMENGLDLTLLGMSFLNRTEMKREGSVMTLTKRF